MPPPPYLPPSLPPSPVPLPLPPSLSPPLHPPYIGGCRRCGGGRRRCGSPWVPPLLAGGGDVIILWDRQRSESLPFTHSEQRLYVSPPLSLTFPPAGLISSAQVRDLCSSFRPFFSGGGDSPPARQPAPQISSPLLLQPVFMLKVWHVGLWIIGSFLCVFKLRGKKLAELDWKARLRCIVRRCFSSLHIRLFLLCP